MRHSVRTKYMISLIGVLAAVVITSLAAINFLLEPYYMKKNEETLISVYEQMSRYLTETGDEELGDDAALYLQSIKETYNIETFLWNSSQQILYSTTNEKNGVPVELFMGYILGREDERTFEEIRATDNYEMSKTRDKKTGLTYLEMFAHYSDSSFSIMRFPIESIRQTVSLVSRFILYCSLFICVIGIMVSWLLTKRLTQPIKKMSELAERMAELDFTARYENEKDYEEMALLGNSMNHMSDHLEKTILELKDANVELKKDIDRKTKQEEMRQEFISGVSHELKTPIALIQGYAEGLRDGITEDPESMEFYCDVIIDEAGKMNNMVRKMLTLSQIEESSERVHVEQLDLIEVTRGVLNSFQIVIRQKEAEVELFSPDHLMVFTDEYMAEEVLRNYIGNALNHLNEKKHIEVRAEKQGQKAHVEVYNTGEMIPEESLDRLWDKFYKVDKARTREYGGNGIGLSIVKAAMETLGCDFGVRNEKEGVTFWCEFDCQ